MSNEEFKILWTDFSLTFNIDNPQSVTKAEFVKSFIGHLSRVPVPELVAKTTLTRKATNV